MSNAQPKILIVDDDRELRDIYVQKFRASGFEVLSARDGQEGFDLAQKVKPDVILTGIIMPRLTGFEMMKQLRGQPATSTVPFVIFSHRGLEEDRRLAEEMGAAAFLVQGRVTPNEIVATAQRLVSGEYYWVLVQVDQLDSARLSGDLKIAQPIKLELRRLPDNQPRSFTAKVVD